MGDEAEHGGRQALRLAHSALACGLIVAAIGCNRRIEEEPPLPEHRYGVCETWCALMFEPECPAREIEAPEEECVEVCLHEEILWAPVGDGVDACAETHVAYVDCLETLSCSEIQRHFALTNMVPTEEQSSCGSLLQAQLDCQSAHY